MQLDAIVSGDRALLYMERYVDEGAKTYSPFAAKSEAAPRYQPRSEYPSFDLVTIFAPEDQVAIFHADPEKSLLDYYIQSDEVRFVIHPETWTTAGIEHLDELRTLRRGESIHVAPTASTRTVFTTLTPPDVPAHFLKLHYPRRISRFNRRLRRKNVCNSIELTRDLERFKFDKFAYLPEALGFIYSSDENAWGFLVREEVPRPFKGPTFLVPCFSLYGGDLHHPDDHPLLVQMIERLGADPQSFVVDEIMIPVLECWAKVVRERGILLESHAQNVLIEIDRDFRPLRIVHRDCDVWVDGDIRRRAGLAPIGSMLGTDAAHSRAQIYSLVYDHFIGSELFDYLLSALVRYYQSDERAIRDCIATAFHRNFPDASNYFPASTTYYFSNELLPGNDFRLVDTKQIPQWR